eukprot:NODE_17_length_48642_cov_1.199349.p17 type:complete len:317 gc:universal NODE_17_length_48642_cov_1.199349:5922-4972(-)
MNHLSVDLFYEIFQYLDVSDVLSFRLVSKNYNSILRNIKWKVQDQKKSLAPRNEFRIYKLSIDAYHYKHIQLDQVLEELWISNCRVTLDLAKLLRLRKLSLISCSKVQINLPKLKYLNLSFSEDAYIGNCERVYHLDISSTGITNLPQTKNLKHLYIDYTPISELHLPGLRELSIEGTNIDNLPDISDCRYLNVSYTPITETHLLKVLPKCDNLKTLEVEGMSISSLLFNCIVYYKIPIRELNANDCEIYSHDLYYFLSNSGIESLSADGTRLDQKIINFLTKCHTTLTYLSVLDVELKLTKKIPSHIKIQTSDCN